ncbi:MAG: alpha/beta hydrolase [Alphaproteobacteria bacterium]|nr:alpha/beta hydrolase [Alphaproteobacteria bacterium]
MNSQTNASAQIRHDVPYGGGPQGDLCLDTYLPEGAGPHPALLCLHGGAWQHGSQRQYQSWGPWLAERGYAVIAVDYRLSSQVSPAWPGVWDDVCRSLDWLLKNASSLRIDPARIGAIGDSAGGHMAAMLSLHERTARHVRAVVGVYGIYDLPAWWRATQPPERSDDPVVSLMGKPYDEMKDAYEDFSPVHRLQKMADPPTARYFIIYGDQDKRVPHVQSEQFVAALSEKGAKVEALRIPGAGHSWFTYADDHPLRRRVDEEPNTTVAPSLLRFLGDMGPA